VLPNGAAALFASSCSAAHCVAVGGEHVPGTLTIYPEVLVSHGPALRWSAARIPVMNGELNGVSCPTASRCVATGTAPYVKGNAASSTPVSIVSTDGGTAWSTAAISNSGGHAGGPVTTVCPTASRCVSAGDVFSWCECGTGTPGHYGESWSSGNGGHTWQNHLFGTIWNLDVWYSYALSCWSSSACLLAAEGTRSGPDDGGSFYPMVIPLVAKNGWAGPGPKASRPRGALQPQWIYGLHCWSSTSCGAVGENYEYQVATEVYSGGTWKNG
jgi:hypothetical protein